MKSNYKRKNNEGFKKYKKDNTDEKKQKDTIVWLLCFAVFGAAAAADLFLAEKHSNISIILNIIGRITWLCGFVYFAFFSKTRPKLPGRIIVSIFAVIPLLALIVDYKIILFSEILCFLINSVYAAYVYIKRHKAHTALNGVFVLGFILLILNVYDFTFENEISYKFAVIAIILTICTVVICVIMLVKKMLPETIADESYEKIALVLGVTIASFIFFYAAMVSFNYIFDFKEPTPTSIVIEKKDVENGYHQPTRFVFYSTVDGKEMHFDVDEYAYSHYNAGDEYIVYQSGGAFDEPYYYSK